MGGFLRYLREQDISKVSDSTVLDFFHYLFHGKGLAVGTIATYRAAIAEPLRRAFGVLLDDKDVAAQIKGFFIAKPAPQRPSPSWSLDRVLDFLRSIFPSSSTPTSDLFEKALFLVALASGLRASQLAALTRFPSWTQFSRNMSSVSLAPSPRFLAKNERVDHRLKPTIVPALVSDGEHHLLCPVQSLKDYMSVTSHYPPEALFVSPSSHKPCSSVQIATCVIRTINRGDPEANAKYSDVRKYAASLEFLRSHSISSVKARGQWASSHPFIFHYLTHSVSDTQCVALSSLPSGSSIQ